MVSQMNRIRQQAIRPSGRISLPPIPPVNRGMKRILFVDHAVGFGVRNQPGELLSAAGQTGADWRARARRRVD